MQAIRAKLRVDAEQHAAACEQQYDRALAAAITSLEKQYNEQVRYDQGLNPLRSVT